MYKVLYNRVLDKFHRKNKRQEAFQEQKLSIRINHLNDTSYFNYTLITHKSKDNIKSLTIWLHSLSIIDFLWSISGLS